MKTVFFLGSLHSQMESFNISELPFPSLPTQLKSKKSLFLVCVANSNHKTLKEDFAFLENGLGSVGTASMVRHQLQLP